MRRWIGGAAAVCAALGAVLVWVGGASAADAPAGADAAHYRTRQILLGYPPIPARADLPPQPGRPADPLRGIRMTLVKYAKIDDAEAERIAGWAAERGFTQILTEGNRYLFYRPGEPQEHLSGGSRYETLDELIANGKRLADACHRHGIQYIVHVTCTMVTKDFLDRHPDWAALDLRTGKRIATAYGPMAACVANPAFEAEYLKRLERLIQGTGADGAMVDEVAFWEHTSCGCAACRARFTQETGLKLPDKVGAGFFGNLDNPVYMRWLQWRTEVIQKMDERIAALVHRYHGVRFNYRSALSLIRYVDLRTGWYATDVLPFTDVQGYECEPPGFRQSGYLYSWPIVVTEMKILRAMSRHVPGAPWVLFYPKTVSDYTWNWLEARSQGVRLWWRSSDEAAEPGWRPLMNWERNHEAMLEGERPMGNIGVLLSMDSALRNPQSPSNTWLYGFTSTCQALTDSQLPYRVVLDRDLTPEGLRELGINTLFLMNAGSLSDREAQVVREFVRAGGTLIASADTSLYDEGGRRRSDFALGEVLGVSYEGTVQSKVNRLEWTGRTPLSPGMEALEHNEAFNRVKVAGGSVVGRMVDEKGTRYPGVIVHAYGRGQSVYFSGHPELKYFFISYHHPIESGHPWTDQRDDAFRQLLARAAVYGDRPAVMAAENFPRGVVVEARRLEAGNLKGIEVHLTNFLGGAIQSGVVPIMADVTFPDVAEHRPDPKKPMTVAVRMEDPPTVAYVISPDFQDAVELQVSVSQGMARVTVPDLYRYQIICFMEKGADAIVKMNGGRVVRKWPAARTLRYEARPPLAGEYDPNALVVFADSKALIGGKALIPLNGEAARVIYGSKTKFGQLTVRFTLTSPPHRGSVVLGAMDDNASSKAPMELFVNGRSVFSGPSPFPDNAWATHAFALPEGTLKAGENVVEIRNTSPSNRDLTPPWLGINFVKLIAGR